MCNLVIIKFNGYYIYLHNINLINYKKVTNIQNMFKGAEKIYFIIDLLQISVNNTTELINMLPSNNYEEVK